MNKLFKRTAFLTMLILIVSMMFGTMVFAVGENPRYLMDAETMPNGTIAVLFVKGGTSSSGVISGGNLYLGKYNPSNNSWDEAPVGGTAPVAKEAALALNGSTAHVAYVTSEDKIAYTRQTGSGWSEFCH